LINNIYIHIGVHKTGSTSIQHTLGEKQYELSRKGYLYPVFKKRLFAIYNHSWPFYSLFSTNAGMYHVNIKDGISNRNELNTLNNSFREQLLNQISSFKGHSLIISGEDISALNKEELRNLKEFLEQSTSHKVSFTIIIFSRHPVDQFRSIIQERVKNGTISLTNHYNSALFFRHYYKNLTLKFGEIFGENNIFAGRYEDALKMPGGTTEMMLLLTGISKRQNFNFKNKYLNISLSTEAVLIHSALNAGGRNIAIPGLKTKFINELINNIPGQPYSLDNELNSHIWSQACEDSKWFCQKFSLPFYEYNKNDFCVPSIKWQNSTVKYLRSIYPLLNMRYRKEIQTLIVSNPTNSKEYNTERSCELRNFSKQLSKQDCSYIPVGINTYLVIINTAYSILREVFGKLSCVIKIKTRLSIS
jgi:hypothetical protein